VVVQVQHEMRHDVQDREDAAQQVVVARCGLGHVAGRGGGHDQLLQGRADAVNVAAVDRLEVLDGRLAFEQHKDLHRRGG